jgi:formate dehydrogenase subunit gamma
VLSITPRAVITDMVQMVVAIANLFGVMKVVSLPPAGRYNGAQRLLGTMIILSSAAIALTGMVMFILFLFTPMVIDGLVFRWALVAHGFFVGLVYIGLVAHIYYALVEEPESLEAMKSGYLDEEYIKHHSPAWHEELKQQGKV